MMLAKNIFVAAFGFSSGVVISGAVFAFIVIIGVVTRIAQKTGTEQYLKYYEEVILWGGILGGTSSFYIYHLPIGNTFLVIASFCLGIFIGCLAVSLAEVLDVIPILSRRGRIQKGLTIFVIAIALGKLCGSLAYFILPGFTSKL